MRTNKMLAWLAHRGVPYNVLMILWVSVGLALGIGAAASTGWAVHHFGSPWWAAEPLMLVLTWAVSMTYYVKTITFVLHLVRARRNEHMW
jgi:peptidoglycan biosynthesis protein MviN/MurJ (putative lipid II flippase)